MHVPLSTFYDAGEVGSEAALRIHTHVREEALQLYGFLTVLEQQLFERLINISGIVPKLAHLRCSPGSSRAISSPRCSAATWRGSPASRASVRRRPSGSCSN